MATLKGKSILVIGGTSGIGYAVARASLTSQAERVIVVSSSSTRVNETLNLLRSFAASSSLPGKVEGKAVDATDLPALDKAISGFGEIDHLVYTSGSSLNIKPFKETDVASMKGPPPSGLLNIQLYLNNLQISSMYESGELCKQRKVPSFERGARLFSPRASP
jgi:NAD(P)-dependent dehydrogenase (short-subunit alcohol dehydrogenase family)